ncbi:terpenoid synthase [Mycena olivaceomarginata]|nr:terpenoid synthase [Mycena olivaceomarginata]
MPAPTSETPGNIYLPETMKHWPLARAFNPHYEEASAASKAWLHGLRPFNPRSQYAFDKGDFEQLRIGCDLMNVFFVIDEYTDVEGPAAVQAMVDIIFDVLHNPYIPRPTGEMGLGEIFRQFWELTLKSAATHFVQSFSDWLKSIVDQARDRESKIPLTLESYVAMRKLNIGLFPSLMPAELQLNLADEVFYHPIVQKLRDCIAELIFLDNDMVSYNKEQATGDICHNILSIVMRELHIELQDAMAWLCECHSQVETKFFEALQNVPSFGPEMDHQLRQYIAGRLSRRACQNGLPRLAEFEFGCAGLDGLAWGWA